MLSLLSFSVILSLDASFSLRITDPDGISSEKTVLISVYDTEEDAVKFENMCIETGLKNHQYIIRRRY